MPITTCPKCSSRLKVAEGAAGAIRCPKCQTAFKVAPSAPAPPAFEVVDDSPPSPPPSATTRPSPAPASAAKPAVPGGASRPFGAAKDAKKAAEPPRTEEQKPATASRKNAPPPVQPAPEEIEVEVEDDIEVVDKSDDDRGRDPPERSRRRRDEDDDDRGRDRPERSRRRRDEDEDDEDDRPRGSKATKKQLEPQGKPVKLGSARPGLLLLMISLCLYAGGIGLHALLLLLAMSGVMVPNGLVLAMGIIGLVNWVVGLVGLSLCGSGPKRSRKLATAALAVSVLHVILAFIVVNDSDSLKGSDLSLGLYAQLNKSERAITVRKELMQEKDINSARSKELRKELKSLSERPGSGNEKSEKVKLRWGDLAVLQTYFDRLFAILSSQSADFSNLLLGIFCGLVELARLILIILLIGSLARSASNPSAASKAKIGWIAASAVAGVALLVMFFCHGKADALVKDVVLKYEPPPTQGKMSVQEYQKVSSEWAEQQVEKSKARFRAPLRWVARGELVAFLLHLGTLVLPCLAAFQIYSSSRSGKPLGKPKKSKRKQASEEDEEEEEADDDRGEPRA